MKETITIWKITPDHKFEKKTIPNTLDALQTEVGGNIEFLSLTYKAGRPMAHGYCNEEGRLEGLPVNAAATIFFSKNGRYSIGVPLVGPVLIVGDGPDGDEDDVPDWIEEAIQEIATPAVVVELSAN